jgi:DNA-binding NtrC family response regulator
MMSNEAILHEMPSSPVEMEPAVLKPAIPSGSSVQPLLLPQGMVQDHVDVEESLNLMDMEKDLIERALKKHKGKRKDAASDLGISERTLYRKLKEYDIDH